MRIHLLKLTIITSLGVLFAIYSLNGSGVRAFSSGPPPSQTGAPGETTCTSCHGGGPTGGTLSLSGLPANYSPNQEITLTVTLSQANRAGFGFQLTAIDDTGLKAGDLIPADGRTQTQPSTVNGNQRQYINHTSSAPASPGQGSWTFRWKAPAQSAGRVTFYAAGNAANGNFSTSGDTIYTTNQSIQPAAALPPFVSASAASFSLTAPLTANGISVGFGLGLAQNGVPGTTIPLPTELDGTSLLVNGVLAGLFFVSPGQINYLVPDGTANGSATITVRRGGADIAQGTATIETVSPGIFTLNASGTGLPAAFIVRARDGAFLPLAQFNPTTGVFDPTPIDLEVGTGGVSLVLFGTGFRAQATASATISGAGDPVQAQVAFAGAVSGFQGLDQANIILPQSLAGRGLVNVVFTANGRSANTIQIVVK